MKPSIRKFLLINLLLAITITTTLTAIGNYFLDQKDIQDHLDSLMAVSALSYQALLGDDIRKRHLEELQTNLNEIPKKLQSYYESPGQPLPINYLNKFNFQVWSSDDNKLLLHSAGIPSTPLLAEEHGFSDIVINNDKWRIFTTENKSVGIKTVLGEQYNTRNELGRKISKDDVYIMLLTFPLAGLLIWIIIGKGLESLDKVAKEVANREPSHLEPVNLEEVPEEVTPVVDELNKLFFRLKEGFEREKRFAADAAHELRTPLAALKAQAQVALNSSDINEKNIALQKLLASVNRSTHVVQQLLTMSKLVPEAITAQDHSEVNLIKVCRETLANLVPSAIEKNIELSFEYKDTPSIKGNAVAIGILIRNLVDNAIRYCHANDKVLVTVYPDANFAVLEITDTGPGIPEELRDRVFERFFRALGHKSTGSGLGLAIVKQICELHNAKITLHTPEKGSGLIVKVSFPIHKHRKT